MSQERFDSVSVHAERRGKRVVCFAKDGHRFWLFGVGHTPSHSVHAWGAAFVLQKEPEGSRLGIYQTLDEAIKAIGLPLA